MSSLCPYPCDTPEEGVGIIFLKNMLEDTKTIADPKAQRRPNQFDADTSKEQASMTPIVKGSNEM